MNDRGYVTEDAIEEYFSPRPGLTYDPFAMKGMNEAADLITEYAGAGRRICIYGDYDCDGVTSVSLMMALLKKLTDNVTYFIPSRFKDGYGLNNDAIDRIHADGVELIVTVDCGCNACEQVEHAKHLGMEIIVTDHHTMDERIPDCIVVNPKQVDDSYPFSGLCGCGVAFKMAQAISRKCDLGKDLLNEVLDIVGIATIGDIVPLRDENRTLVKYGMNKLRRCRRKGLRDLLAEAGIDPAKINSRDIAFGIVPRLNSAGRLRSADIALNLLSSDAGESNDLARELNQLNEERKSIQNAIFNNAVREIDAREAGAQRDNFIVYYAGAVNEGVTGIVAGKLREVYNRPVIILTDMEDGSFVKGTGRSMEGIHLHDLLSPCIDWFKSFGGHAGACGFTLYRDRIDDLTEYVNNAVGKLAAENPSLFDTTVKTEAVIDSSDISLELAEGIDAMEPFGADNLRPLFTVENVYIRNIFAMGKENQYRKLQCEGTKGNRFEGVIFDTRLAASLSIRVGDTVAVKGDISVNRWNGRTTLQIDIKELS